MDMIKKYFPSPENVNVLEIGPGANLASGVYLILGGVKHYYAVDIYRDPEFDNPLPYQSISLIADLFMPELNKNPQDQVFTIKGDQAVLNPKKITYIYPYLSSNFPMDSGLIDFLFSNSSFEHFVTPRETIQRIYDVLKKGGITAHSIDLRDHTDFAKPYEFLKYDSKTWTNQFSDENIHLYTNRWRASNYRKAFESAGFEILEFEQKSGGQLSEHDKPGNPLTEKQRATFSNEFKDYTLDELAVTYVFLVARKK